MAERTVPRHIAIILDGNGRWAKAKGKPRTFGHKAGAENVEHICEAASDLGVEYLTMYAFSTENWSRPDGEVSALMSLISAYIKKCKKLAMENNMRVRFIGDRSGLSDKIQERMRDLEEVSSVYTGMTLIIALNYGSRDEMIRGMRKMADDGIPSDQITEELFSSYLDTDGIPDPDLMIRTSGEQRLSNYLLWQLAYAEFYFTPVPWPDFKRAELEKAIEVYADRDRRYGGV